MIWPVSIFVLLERSHFQKVKSSYLQNTFTEREMKLYVCMCWWALDHMTTSHAPGLHFLPPLHTCKVSMAVICHIGALSKLLLVSFQDAISRKNIFTANIRNMFFILPCLLTHCSCFLGWTVEFCKAEPTPYIFFHQVAAGLSSILSELCFWKKNRSYETMLKESCTAVASRRSNMLA